MEHQLQELRVPPHVSIQKKLLSIFGINNKGYSTKDLHQIYEVMIDIVEGKKWMATMMNLKGNRIKYGKEEGG